MATSAEHTRHSRKTSHPPRDAGQPTGRGALREAHAGTRRSLDTVTGHRPRRLLTAPRGAVASSRPLPAPGAWALAPAGTLPSPHATGRSKSHSQVTGPPMGDTTRKTASGRTHVALSSSQLLPCTSSLVLPGVCAVEATRTAPHRAETEAPRRGHRSRDSSLGPAPAPGSWPRPLPGQGERKGGRGQESLGPQTSTGPRPRPPHGSVSTGDRGIRRVSQQVTLTAVGLG